MLKSLMLNNCYIIGIYRKSHIKPVGVLLKKWFSIMGDRFICINLNFLKNSQKPRTGLIVILNYNNIFILKYNLLKIFLL